MSASESTPIKKTKTLSIKKIPESSTLITVAQACDKFIGNVRSIRLVKPRNENLKNAMIDFISSKHCEDAKNTYGKILIDGQTFELNYARSVDNAKFNAVASEDTLYVKYPENVTEAEVIKLLGNVSIKKPEHSSNFLFAKCDSIDQQCDLVKKLDNMQIGDGHLTVKIAINKAKKPRTPRRSDSN